MSLVCIVAVVCAVASDAGVIECDIVKSECFSVPDERETEIRKWCAAAPNCVEISKRIFVIREQARPTPVVPAPPPVRGGGRV